MSHAHHLSQTMDVARQTSKQVPSKNAQLPHPWSRKDYVKNHGEPYGNGPEHGLDDQDRSRESSMREQYTKGNADRIRRKAKSVLRTIPGEYEENGKASSRQSPNNARLVQIPETHGSRNHQVNHKTMKTSIQAAEAYFTAAAIDEAGEYDGRAPLDGDDRRRYELKKQTLSPAARRQDQLQSLTDKS